MKKFIHLILTVCLIAMMSISAFGADTHVYDDAGLLDSDEWINLEQAAAAVSEKYGAGVYVIAVKDYRDYGNGDAFQTATELYHGLELGEGADREGMLLMISMEDRDYATFFYGDHVEYAFDEYGQMRMEEEFLDDLGENDWYEGFADYIEVCDEYLERAAEGNPVRKDMTMLYVIAVGVSVVLAFLVTFGLRMTMISVHKGGSAAAYVTEEGLRLTQRGDYFLYNTQTRRRIESSNKSSGSRSGGGGSGRSGKF